MEYFINLYNRENLQKWIDFWVSLWYQMLPTHTYWKYIEELDSVYHNLWWYMLIFQRWYIYVWTARCNKAEKYWYERLPLPNIEPF